ncbi:MAG: stage V sporulation protein AE [Ruminococcus sp.]|nr:stage V sporulation protein AE [Ruminococcus sp.]
MSYVFAFITGGLICVIGQVLIDKTKLTPARILTGYVVAGVFISAVGLYEPLVEFASCGATVPLSGFGHLMAQGVKESVDTYGALGILKGPLSAASAGITAAVVLSLIASLISKSKEK